MGVVRSEPLVRCGWALTGVRLARCARVEGFSSILASVGEGLGVAGQRIHLFGASVALCCGGKGEVVHRSVGEKANVALGCG